MLHLFLLNTAGVNLYINAEKKKKTHCLSS